MGVDQRPVLISSVTVNKKQNISVDGFKTYTKSVFC